MPNLSALANLWYAGRATTRGRPLTFLTPSLPFFLPLMVSLQGHAEVLSATAYDPTPVPRNRSKTSLAPQDASSSLRSIHSLFAVPDAHDGGDERAQKRRKVENGDAVAVQQADFDEDKSIVLAKVSLDLVCIQASHGDFLTDEFRAFPPLLRPM